MKQPNPHDIARARRIVAALAADDKPAATQALAEAKAASRLMALAVALAQHNLEIAREFYDIDCYEILTRKALSALDDTQIAEDDDAQNADD